MSAIAVANLAALIATSAFLIASATVGSFESKDGRASFMTGVGVECMAIAGMLRRFDHPAADVAVTAAWVILATVMAWQWGRALFCRTQPLN